MKKNSAKEKVSKAAKKFDRSAYRTGLVERTKASYDQRDSFGSTTGIFKTDAKFTKWVTKIGDHLIDILPYIVGDKDTKLEEGSITYFYEVWVHYSVGPNEGAYACPTKNFNRPCPICEHQKKLRLAGAPDEEIKVLYPKRRVLYNIVCRDSTEEENKGVQVWEVSHFHSEKHFAELARKPKGGGFIPFADPDAGKMVFFNRVSKMEMTGHRFVERDEAIDDDLLEQTLSLDQIVHEAEYDELYEAFYGSKKEDEDEEAAPRKRKKPVVEEPEEEPEEESEAEEESEESDWEEEDEEPEPAPKKKPLKDKPKKKPKPEEDWDDADEESEDELTEESEDDTDDDWDDDEPAKPASKPAKKKR